LLGAANPPMLYDYYGFPEEAYRINYPGPGDPGLAQRIANLLEQNGIPTFLDPEFAKALPEDTVILTAGCAKYRYNKLPLGEIDGIPRVLDAGQCNDSYSLVVIALKLKEIFGLEDINQLPIAFNIAWYEQKAVIVLLALLSLGVKNIHLGPSLPGFLSPNVGKVLVENFGISSIGTVEDDLELFLQEA
jgi:hydroxylamine reductase